MIKVDQYQLIRRLYAVEGLSQREIARRLGISRIQSRSTVRVSTLPLRRLLEIGSVKSSPRKWKSSSKSA